ncbi:uncharacterized protein N7473_005825 [Penicillium subrubescens]|uniref:Zn(2)-C6 fungal-type domain-containing protein n=1 Tax=Penicillium subrubescens TaxID=1316194 RepID=A0A1Q5UGP1_9EURO|nr:uncharacterized protein N7473_005825 [Penicillium subrubescens]KAJ5896426.1 hypothetical protein N7473_005825 [Penicillium subrubescens]OKP11650.1 hypothetical protein PENSUB_2722 [Penicillium subrubescens]
MPSRSSESRSRQKSCVACAEGKRRCNRQTPQCSRCLGRGLKCTYINGSSAKKRHKSLVVADLQPIESEFYDNLDDILSLWSPNSDSLIDSSSATASWHTGSPSLLDTPLLFPAIFFPETAAPDKWSITQSLRCVKSFPQMFARSRRTPFIHQRLYDTYLPNAIQDAFTVSAAYCTRAPGTEDMSLRVLEAKTASLLQQVNQTTSVEELLASVQALMLFHIIQLFDGDIRQRSLAERNMDTLRTWTTRLQVQAEDLGHATSWQEWILAESIRRTVIFSALIDSLYSSLKHGYCKNVKALSMLPFTSRPELWDLTTSAAWLTESSQSGSEVVLYGDFSMAWENGRVLGELDYFQKLLLIPCVGERYKDVLELENVS